MSYGIQVGRKRVERLMRQAGLSGLVPKRRGQTTIRVPGLRVADGSSTVGSGRHRTRSVADVTYLRTCEGGYSSPPPRRVLEADRGLIDGRSQALGSRRRCAEHGDHASAPRGQSDPSSDQALRFISLAFDQAGAKAGIAASFSSLGCESHPDAAGLSECRRVRYGPDLGVSSSGLRRAQVSVALSVAAPRDQSHEDQKSVTC
jgi:transposase InsO family protein